MPFSRTCGRNLRVMRVRLSVILVSSASHASLSTSPSPPERRIGLGRNRMDVHRLTYAVVTPVRDEARSLPPLAGEPVFGQSVHPSCWVIADTGSTDETPEVIERLASQVTG